MELIWAIILGLIQGLTEFLPVSSSGHLVLFQSLFDLKNADLFFDTVLHLGTLFAIVVFFKKEIFLLIQKTLTAIKQAKLGLLPKEALLLILASLPAFLVGFFGLNFIKGAFSSPKILPFTFLTTALLLFFTKEKKDQDLFKNIKNVSKLDALTIGFWQALAILPGVSRSGSTYAGALGRNVKRETAFYFSFLIAIPAIFGAFLLELVKIKTFSFDLSHALGMLSAFFSSMLALLILKKIVRMKKVHLFSVYCLFLSLISFYFFF